MFSKCYLYQVMIEESESFGVMESVVCSKSGRKMVDIYECRIHGNGRGGGGGMS